MGPGLFCSSSIQLGYCPQIPSGRGLTHLRPDYIRPEEHGSGIGLEPGLSLSLSHIDSLFLIVVLVFRRLSQ